MTFHDCCRQIIENCKDPYAKSYANAGLCIRDPHEIKVQALYILANITHWQGDTAKTVRSKLKKFSNG